MSRASVAILVAVCMIAGWSLQIGKKYMPGWDEVGFIITALAFSVLVEIADRTIRRAIRDEREEPDGGAR